MATIGKFTATNNGYTGTISTLTVNASVAFVPNADRSTDKSPHFHLISNGTRVGAAWEKVSEQESRYLSVNIDDPSFPSEVWSFLFPADDGSFNLVWNRRRAD